MFFSAQTICIFPRFFLTRNCSNYLGHKRKKKSVFCEVARTQPIRKFSYPYKKTTIYIKKKNNIHKNKNKQSIVKEVDALHALRDDLSLLTTEYENLLGNPPLTYLDYKDKFNWMFLFEKKTNNPVNIIKLSISRLFETEDKYKDISLKMRRLLTSWSSLRIRYSCSDLSTLNTNYDNIMVDYIDEIPDIAESYLIQLEKLRLQRQTYLEQCLTLFRDKEKYSHVSSSIFGILMSDIFSNTTIDFKDDVREELEKNITSHLSPDYAANSRLYKELMKCRVYWFNRSNNIEEEKDFIDKPLLCDNETFKKNLRSLSGQSRSLLYASLGKSLTATLDNMSSYYASGNIHVRPDREVYKFIMKQYCHRFNTYDEAENSRKLLYRMIDSSYCNDEDNYLPSLSTFHNVLTSYKQSIRNTNNKSIKKKSVMAAEKIWLQLEELQNKNNSFNKMGKRDNSNSGLWKNKTYDVSMMKPSFKTYKLILSTLQEASYDTLGDICSRADIIMEKMMGIIAFRQWIGEPVVTDKYFIMNVDNNVPDMKFHHIMILIYSRSKDPKHLVRCKILLKKMERRNRTSFAEKMNVPREKVECLPFSLKHFSIRQSNIHTKGTERQEIYDGTNNEVLVYPTTHTYNAILRCILHQALVMRKEFQRREKGRDENIISKAYYNDEKKKSTTHSYAYVSFEDNAMFANGLLDNMILKSTSMPNTLTFQTLLQLWNLSRSARAGEKAEEILNQTELYSILKYSSCDNLHVTSGHLLNLYQKVISCWALSAKAFRRGSALHAKILLDKIEAQYQTYGDKKNINKIFSTMNTSFRIGDFPRTTSIDDLTPSHSVYTAVIYVCACTRLETDKSHALRIAFEVYNRMIDQNISPNSKVYGNLLSCCDIIPHSRLDQKIRLSTAVFKAAYEHGVIDKFVLNALKQVNRKLFDSYNRKQDYSFE